jgi:signal transduction histidine kinase
MQVDTEGATEALARIRVSAREAIDEMQALLTQLRAAPVERTGLVEALRRQCEALEHRTGAAVRFHAGAMPEPMALPSRAYENVYRVAQEALHNVGRHARARNVQVRLEVEGLQFVLEVRDDGAGFPANQTASKPSGMGIRNMRQRAEETGGNFELWSHPGEGTRIVLRIPLHSLDAVEHRRQAGVQGALLTVLVAFVMLRTPNPFVVIALPVAIVLGYHLRALWLARGAGAPQL